MRSDEIELMARESAHIGSVAAWPDWPATRILRIASQRHKSLMVEQEIRARAGYGTQKQILTCVVGQDFYPVPPRAAGGAFEKLEIQLPGQTKWEPLLRVDVTGAEEFELGNTFTGRPERYCVQDGFVQLYKTPDAAYPLRFTYFMRPSQLVQSQSSTLGGDGAVRGQITVAPVGSGRTITVNALPFDQLASPPAALTSNVQRVDIVRPNGTFSLCAYSLPQTFVGVVFTLGGTDSLARVQVGDFVRVEDQTDWPMGLPDEFHPLVGTRTAMEIARDIGVEEKIQTLGQATEADLKRFEKARDPQVKSAPKIIPLRPMFRR